jgi:dUTPase
MKVNGKTNHSSSEKLLKLRKFVSDDIGISIEEMILRSRKREIVFARQSYCWLAKKLIPGDPGLAIIGSFIEKDHATVMHAVKTIDNLMDTNRFINDRMMNMKERVTTIIENIKVRGEFHLSIKTEATYSLEEIMTHINLKAYVARSFVIESGEKMVFATGIYIDIPKNAIGIVKSMSGKQNIYISGNEIMVTINNELTVKIIINPYDIIGTFTLFRTATISTEEKIEEEIKDS